MRENTKNGECKPVTAIIVGAGHRAMIYASLADRNPELLKIVGVADPNPLRCRMVREKYGFSEEMCFSTAEELAAKGKLADAIINGTMDKQHVETAIPLLECGYDMLLEKPFALNEEEALRLAACAKKNNTKVMICHVLRYAPFYYSIKERIAKGDIGEIVNIQQVEHVSYHHMSIGYVRGKWANSKECYSTMLLAKSCHDLDIMMWLMSDTKPVQISSFGGRYQFVPENAPEGAGTICMKDCPYVDTCFYSSKRLYLEHPKRWAFYVWDKLEHLNNPTDEDRIALLQSDSPYGRCIYKCDNDVVDRQAVMVNFASGATGTFNMIGGAAASMRSIHIIGTKGEIFGEMEKSQYTVRMINPDPHAHNGECDVEEVDLNVRGDMTGAFGGHGGGDERLTLDFVNYVRGEKASMACTSIFDSLTGHLAVYKADQSREMGGVPIVFEGGFIY